MKPRSTNIDVLNLDAFFGHQLLKRLENDFFANTFLGAIQAERFEAKIFEQQSPCFIGFKLGQLDTAGSEIDRQK